MELPDSMEITFDILQTCAKIPLQVILDITLYPAKGVMGSFHRPPLLNDGTFRERKQEEAETDNEREKRRGTRPFTYRTEKG